MIALITVTVIALLLAGLLSLSNASQRNTQVSRDHEAKVYAADAGVDYGIQAMRRDNTLCPTATPSGPPTLIGTQVINGATVDITCQTYAGSATGIFGYAVIALDSTGPSIDTQGGFFNSCDPFEQNPNNNKYCPPSVEGPAYAARLPDSLTMKQKNGDMFEHASAQTCSDLTTEANKPPNLVFEPLGAYHYRCTTDSDPYSVAGDPGPTLPSAVPAAAAAPVMAGQGNKCKVFKPGLYTAATMSSDIVGEDAYFVSGVYYLVGVNLTLKKGGGLKENVIRGGAADASEARVDKAQSPCDSVTDADGGGSTGTGVKVILGGTSKVFSDNDNGRIELFARKGGPAAEGTQGVSVMSVPNTPGVISAGWTPSILMNTDTILGAAGNPGVVLAVHGLAYVPNAKVDIFATNNGAATLQGGAVVSRLLIQGSATAKNLAVSVPTSSGVRKTVITATARGRGRDVVSRAVVTIGDDAVRTVTVSSWVSDKR